MTENTPETLQKIVENLILDLEQNQDCSECEECPFWLKHVEDEPTLWKTQLWMVTTQIIKRKILGK